MFQHYLSGSTAVHYIILYYINQIGSGSIVVDVVKGTVCSREEKCTPMPSIVKNEKRSVVVENIRLLGLKEREVN